MAGDFAAAEALYRANLVQYLRWVHEHTLPAIAAKMSIADKIVDVDREALTELANAIAECMARLGQTMNIVPFLNHLESVVSIGGFEKDVSYLRASWLYIALNDQASARNELRKIGPILEYRRRQALELYLDVCGTELTEREKVSIAENIIAQSNGDSRSRVQYTALKAIALLQIGEGQHGMEELGTLLAEIDCSNRPHATDTHAIWQLARAWCLYGNFKNDDTARTRAEQLLLSIEGNTLTPLGKAQLSLDLGWVFRDREKYAESAKAFRRSQEIAASSVAKVHLVHSLALSGEAEKARMLLGELEQEELGADLQLEYLSAKGSVAIATADKNLTKETIDGLQAMDIISPFWAEQRDQVQIQMLEFLHRPETVAPAARQRTIVKLLSFLNEVMELKPNFFGLGVNVNKVVEKLARRLGDGRD